MVKSFNEFINESHNNMIQIKQLPGVDLIEQPKEDDPDETDSGQFKTYEVKSQETNDEYFNDTPLYLVIYDSGKFQFFNDTVPLSVRAHTERQKRMMQITLSEEPLPLDKLSIKDLHLIVHRLKHDNI